jgi:PAS domain S-box-containing protein
MPIPLRVLIVEDSESDAALLVRLFTKANYQVTSQRVETRDSLRAALAQDDWDCVIADHNMPDLDAFAALETLQSTGLDIPFIVASGSLGEETAVALMKSGAADYVMKDKMARLTAVTERELRDAATRRERRQALDALRANEEKYRRLFDLESDALFLIQRDSGRILEANAGATALYGYSHDEWLTMRNVDVSAEPDSTTAATRTAATNIPVRWHRKKNGTVFPVDIRATHFEWEGHPVHLAAIRDVTERVHAQEDLRAERDRAESYLRIAGVILVALDVRGKITLINRRGCEVLGYDEDELLGRDWFDACLSPADRQTVRAGFDQIIAGDARSMANYVNTVITKAGEPRLVSWRNSLLRDAEGRPLGTLSSGEDITERRRAELALQESEARLRDITFSMADWVWEVNENGVYTYSSQKGSDLLGRSSEDIIGKTPFDFMPPDDAKRIAATFSEIVANKAPIKDLENWNITQNGERRCLLTNGVPILDEGGHLTGYRGVDKDITERKRAEEELQLSQQKLSLHVEQTPLAVIEFDLDGRVLQWNPAAVATFGFSREEAIGKCWTFIAPAAIHGQLEGVWSAIVDQRGGNRSTNENITKDGRTISCEWFNTPLAGPGGRSIGVASLIQDVTERKLAEDTIRASLREKELLLKEIHHRVKNNLQIIASLLTLQAQSVRDPVALEVLQDSQNRIRAMSLIHAKLYESSNLATVDFGAFVRDLGAILLRAYAVNPSAIHLRVSAGQADLDVDTLVPCSLIMNELLANAIKHAFPSGAGGTVTVALSHQDGVYVLRVADDGIDFPSTVNFRETKTLGLRLVNMLVEQLDGTIELLSKGGTEFTIRFAGMAAPKG